MQLTLTFREKDEAGRPLRRNVAACASIMALPHARVELMLHRALRAIPLAIDHDPVVVIQPASYLTVELSPILCSGEQICNIHCIGGIASCRILSASD